MTATYTNQPGVVDRDTVRFEVDDKNCDPETNAKLSDEEIDYLIDSNANALYAAAAAAEAIGAQYVADPTSKMVGDLQLSYGEQVEKYKGLASRLRRRAAVEGGKGAYAGGLSETDKETILSDPDRVSGSFAIGMNDSQYAAEQTGEMNW